LGDQHGDYYSFAHAHAPYSDQIHVPLAVYGIKKGQYDNLVSIKDIPALIRVLAGLTDEAGIPQYEFILSEYIRYNSSLPRAKVAGGDVSTSGTACRTACPFRIDRGY
jgi:hypothetical protein